MGKNEFCLTQVGQLSTQESVLVSVTTHVLHPDRRTKFSSSALCFVCCVSASNLLAQQQLRGGA